MPLIDDFRDITGAINFAQWRFDIIIRLLDDMDNAQEGLTTRGLCRLYFDAVDTERMIVTGDQMQAIRGMLEARATPLLLANRNRRWYIVHPNDPAAARGFISERTRRMVRAHLRLGRYSEIGQETYQLPSDDGLLQAIRGADPTMRQLAAAVGLEQQEDDD